MTTPPPSDRPNNDAAELVEAAIVLNEQQGRARAAAYLTENGVPFSVIVRVLAGASRRRQGKAESTEV